jgi:hypothetical protein
MVTNSGRRDVDRTVDEETTISAHETSPGRVVFTEEDNNDGWIATDHTVDVER